MFFSTSPTRLIGSGRPECCDSCAKAWERDFKSDSGFGPAKLFRPLCLHLKAEDLAGLRLCENLERTTANLAIGGEPLLRDAGVDHQFHALTAVRALDFFTFLHDPPWSGTGGLPSEDPSRKN